MARVYLGSVALPGAPLDSVDVLKRYVSQSLQVSPEDIYITTNGKITREDSELRSDDVIRVCTRLVGGKGGFGSMLRAIGAQIEKTTNREACRDLSGRRLRDINEEQRLRKWLEGQADREKEAVERKQKKLERLCAEPRAKTDLGDPAYESERRALPERVSEAVDAGWAAASTSSGSKRKAEQDEKKKKKKKLWLDNDLSECSSSDGDTEAETEREGSTDSGQTKREGSTDSGHESDRLSNNCKVETST